MALPEVYQLPLLPVEKRCTKCGEWLPPDHFSVKSTAPDGLRSQCKACDAAARRNYAQRNPDKIRQRQHEAYWRDPEARRARARDYQHAHPDKVRERNQRYTAANREKVREWGRQHYHRHRAARSARVRSYYRMNRERIAERDQRYRTLHRESLRERNRAYVEAHPDRKTAWSRTYYERHLEEIKGRARQWRRSNRLIVNAKTHRRRALKRAAEGFWTATDIQNLEVVQAGRCAYCTQPYRRYHVEHKQPLCKGGSNWPDNLCLSCATCNHRKGRKTEAEFRAILAAERG